MKVSNVPIAVKSTATIHLLIDKVRCNDPLLLPQRCYINTSTTASACQADKAVPVAIQVDSDISDRSPCDIGDDISGKADVAQEEILEGEISINHRFATPLLASLFRRFAGLARLGR